MTWPIHTLKCTPLPLLLILVLFLAACSDHSSEGHDEHGEEPHSEQGGRGDGSHEEGVVVLRPEMLERVTIRTAAASVRVLPAELLTTGKVDFEQDRLAHVTPRIPGRVETASTNKIFGTFTSRTMSPLRLMRTRGSCSVAKFRT